MRAWQVVFPDLDLGTFEMRPLLMAMMLYFKRTTLTLQSEDAIESLLSHPVIHLDYHDLVLGLSEHDFALNLMRNPLMLLSTLSLGATEVLFEMLLESNPSRVFKTSDVKIVRILHYDVFTHLKDLKANLMGKFISIRGNVVRASSIKPIVTQLAFKCLDCDSSQTLVLQDGKLRHPTACTMMGCRSKKFAPDRSIESETATVDWQRIRVQEKLASDQADAGRVPRTIECELTRDLVDTVVPGDVVTVTGFVKVLSTEEGKIKANAGQMYYLYLDAHSLTKAGAANNDSMSDISTGLSKDHVYFSSKELKGFKEVLSYGNAIFKLLVNSLCPSIYGHELVKAGLLLTLFGGRQRNSIGRDVAIRSNPHILVVGDPGLGKSQMLGATCKLAPRGVYVCGNTTTTSGLTVTVCKDSDTGDTALEAGALILGDQGVCCIDEFDKMSEHQALLEAMEQQSVSVAKAGIICTLPARTSIIAAANPVGGHYKYLFIYDSKAKTVAENLKMGSALLSRFDLVFILLDKPNEHMDKFLSDHVMKLHSGKGKAATSDFVAPEVIRSHHSNSSLSQRLLLRENEVLDPVPAPLLRKYIAYARMHVQPRMTREAADVLQSFYLNLRSKYRSVDATPITTRQLESMIRLSEARARSELREEVTKEDATDIVELMKFSLWETYEDELGVPDFQRSQHGTGMSKKGEPKRFVGELQALARASGNKLFTYDELLEFAKRLRLNFDRFQDLLDALNMQGYLLKKGSSRYELSIA